MTGILYTRFELLRTLRNWRLLMFALGFPLVLYFAIAAPNRDVDDWGGTGIPQALYYMVGLVGFGTMMALISTGARIATERTNGWTQLRVTPLSGHAYLRAKVATGYAMVLLTMAMLYGSGLVLGVSLPVERWLVMTGLILVGLIPFAALGVIVADIAQFLPSYWLVQASHVSLGASAWPAMGWIVVGAWSVVLTVLAGAAYRRDTARV